MSQILMQKNMEEQNPASPLEIPNAKAAEKAGHLLFLDGLRALAALFVIAHHSWLEIWPSALPSGPLAKWTNWLIFGHYAVALFITLSGFSLMLSVIRNNGILRGGAKTFFLRRARRILPPYYFALGLSLLLCLTLIGKPTGTHWDVSVGFGKRDVLHHLTLTQDLFGAGAINHAFWSIAVECHYYLFFPLLVWSWRKFGPMTTTAAAFAISLIGAQKVSLPLMHPALFPFFTLFALGMLAATLCYYEKPNWRKWRDNVPWLALALILLALAIKTHRSRFSDYADYPFGLACMALLIAVGRSPQGKIRAALSWRPLVFIGGFSYSIYLIHAPLIQLFWQYVLHPLRLSETATFLLLELVGTPLFVAVAYGFYWYCERPYLTPALKKAAVAKT